jgi:hypothetical protein
MVNPVLIDRQSMLQGPESAVLRANLDPQLRQWRKDRIGMRSIVVRLGVAAMLLANMLLVFTGSALADSRCGGGKGITVWQDANESGPSATWCANSNGQLNIPDLSAKTDNLSFGANWNNRISSWQTFNMTSGLISCLVQLTNYNYSDPTRNSRITGNNTLDYVGSRANDQASSVRLPASSCPTS